MGRAGSTDGRRAAGRGGALALLLALAVAGCGADEGPGRQQAAAAARAALQEGDASRALHLAKGALEDFGEDPLLLLRAAEACLALERFQDAVDSAVRGQQLEPDEALAAELAWAEGMARFGLWKGLRQDAEWRRANTRLEAATRAGGRRLDAAYALVLLQAADPELGSDERLLRFARLVRQLAPDSKEATAVSALAAQRGLEP